MIAAVAILPKRRSQPVEGQGRHRPLGLRWLSEAEARRGRLTAEACSVPLEHPTQPGNNDGGEQPTGEGEPERRPPLSDEGVPLLEVHHGQQQIRRVAERVELRLLLATLRWV